MTIERAFAARVTRLSRMKKSTRQQAKPTTTIKPISTGDLHRVVGGANVIYVKPVKSAGGLDLSED